MNIIFGAGWVKKTLSGLISLFIETCCWFSTLYPILLCSNSFFFLAHFEFDNDWRTWQPSVKVAVYGNTTIMKPFVCLYLLPSNKTLVKGPHYCCICICGSISHSIALHLKCLLVNSALKERKHLNVIVLP